jgi:signal transduction histidine kinase/FixJ family two-component response regulator
MNNTIEDEKKLVEILIVEDSPTQAMELEYILGQSAYIVYIARDGEEALALINQHKPVIVISDIVMPGMDGFELCKHIKENELLKNIYVILLTTLSEPKDVIKSLQCGADKFLTKPYDEELLLSTVEHLLYDSSLPDSEKAEKVIEVLYDGQKYSIHSSRMQIISLLISTYEAAVIKNIQLIRTQDELKMLNKNLEERVKERTADLLAKKNEINIMSQQLWQASKLATMGELAASIAHELNNPLATVNLRIESLLAQVPQEDPKRRALEIVEEEIDRMGALVANLLQFGRARGKEISTIDICKEIDNTLELIYYHMRKYKINILREFLPGIPYIHADRQQLRQLFLNLFTNSSDAMSQGGTLTIRVYKQESGVRGQGPAKGQRADTGIRRQETESEGLVADPCSLFSDPPSPILDESSAFVVIEIIDSGTGIPPEILPKIVEPFFTTKPEGKGTGLGLPICRRIVQEHNGVFNIESEAGKGTSVYIRLPVTNGSNCALLKEKQGD